MAEVREMLIAEFFTYGNAIETTNLKARIKRLQAYLKNNKHDKEIEYILIYMLVDKEDSATHDFERCKKIAMPAFELVKEAETRTLTLTEVAVLAKLIGFAPTFDLIKSCAKIVADLLESEYRQEKRHNNIKFMLSSYATSRLVRAKYPSVSSLKAEGDLKEIEALFEEHLNICKNVYSKNNLPVYQAFGLLWEGIFYLNGNLIDQSLSQLKDISQKVWYYAAVDYLLRYYTHLESELTKNQMDIVVGYRVNQELQAQDISIGDAAKYLGLTKSGLSQILTGRRGAKAIHLYNLAELLGVEETSFFRGRKEYLGEDGQPKALITEIIAKLEKAPDKVKRQISEIIDTLKKE